ncbi:ABC transporter ATP-binding protein, partial [Modestobacter roseus]|nr:ABC transporter ATP-binding protein [Modestobacter roseus]MQA36422.1 ABC transporter ATP-binding protein [Modestobacter roseus]
MRLAADGVRLAYGEKVVVDSLDLELTDGSFTAIV